MWQSEAAASPFCFTYCCIFCDPLDCFDHRATREIPARAPSPQRTSRCCPHLHSFHGQTNATKKNTESLYYNKILNFLSSNDTFKKVERQTRVEKIFPIHITEKGLMSSYILEWTRWQSIILTSKNGNSYSLTFKNSYRSIRACQVALLVKNQPASAGDVRDKCSIPRSGRSPGGGHDNPLQYFAWRIPWTEEPGGLQSIGLQRAWHHWSDLACMHRSTR